MRHGQTRENVLHITQGHFNSQLTAEGLEQAKKAALFLKEEKINIAFCSDLDRCFHTAQEILKFHPKTKLKVLKRLREQSRGIFEGKPSIHSREAVAKSGESWWDFRPQDGETMRQVQQRTIQFFEQLVEKYKGKRVLWVSHGGPMTTLFLTLLKKEFENYREYHPNNTAITIIEIDETHRFKLFNSVAHLE